MSEAARPFEEGGPLPTVHRPRTGCARRWSGGPLDQPSTRVRWIGCCDAELLACGRMSGGGVWERRGAITRVDLMDSLRFLPGRRGAPVQPRLSGNQSEIDALGSLSLGTARSSNSSCCNIPQYLRL